MKCSNCGAEIMPGAQFCQVCGATQTMQQGFNNMGQSPYQQPMYQGGPVSPVSSEDAPVILKIISFVIPIVGIVLWAVKRKEEPVAAKSYITWGLAGFAFSFILGLLF